jgi:hypothetical protein
MQRRVLDAEIWGDGVCGLRGVIDGRNVDELLCRVVLRAQFALRYFSKDLEQVMLRSIVMCYVQKVGAMGSCRTEKQKPCRHRDESLGHLERRQNRLAFSAIPSLPTTSAKM